MGAEFRYAPARKGCVEATGKFAPVGLAPSRSFRASVSTLQSAHPHMESEGRDVAIKVLQEANVSRNEQRMPMVKESKQTISAAQINVVLN